MCPVSKERLVSCDAGGLQTADGRNRYRIANGTTPILVANETLARDYAADSTEMNFDYSAEGLNQPISWLTRLNIKDYRTKDSIAAHEDLYKDLPEDAVCISIGGGPGRAHPKLLNVNIGPFPNVDLVGDAHQLPYADASVDVIYCEAVFEHLHTPVQAAKELSRVLKPGAMAYVCTPFLFHYHGYPHHYQNFTMTGHVLLFERAGLKVVKHGVCVGPVFALRNLVGVFIANYIPPPFGRIFRFGWACIAAAIAPMDRILANHKNAHVMATTTYLIAQKP